MSHEQEVFEISRHLRNHAKDNFARLPEGSITRVLNNASPEARLALARQFKVAEHMAETSGRSMPFDEPVYESEQRQSRPKELNAAIDKLQTEVLAQDLSTRMGTTQPDQPTTLRDVIDASFGE